LHELYTRNSTRWLGALPDLPERFVFQRGLLEVNGHPTTLDRVHQYAPPQAVPWLETLAVDYGQQKWIANLIGSDALTHFSGLELTAVRLTPPWLEGLANSPRVSQVRRLCLALNNHGPQKPVGEALARGTCLGGLRSLEVREGLSDGSLAALAEAPWLAGLTALDFGAVGKSIAALIRSPHAPRPRVIRWDWVKPGRAGMRDLIESPLLDEVVELRLERADIGMPGKAEPAAFAARDWPRLRTLSLQGNHLNEEGMRALAGVKGFTALKYLNLKWSLIDLGALRALLSAPWVGGLERLDLGGAVCRTRPPYCSRPRRPWRTCAT
jgi:hypothetical protein